MSQIGVLTASVSTLFNLDYLPERILIGDLAKYDVVSNLSIVSKGQQLMSVTSADRITAMSKFDQGAIDNTGEGQLTPVFLRLAVARINLATSINLTNATANNEDVFASSTARGNVARTAVEQTINQSANQTFTDFEGLFFDDSNVLRANLTFADGFNDDYSPQELRALFASENVADADGTLNGLTCIKSNRPGENDIVQAVIYTTSGGAVTVLKTSYVVL